MKGHQLIHPNYRGYDVIETTDVQTHIRISETKSRWVSRFRTFPVQETL